MYARRWNICVCRIRELSEVKLLVVVGDHLYTKGGGGRVDPMYIYVCEKMETLCIWGGGPSGTRGAAGRRLRRPLGSRRRLRPQAARYIPGSSPQAPKATFGSAPCACVLVSPLYYKPSMNMATIRFFEPDSLIAVFWHFLSFVSFDCLSWSILFTVPG